MMFQPMSTTRSSWAWKSRHHASTSQQFRLNLFERIREKMPPWRAKMTRSQKSPKRCQIWSLLTLTRSKLMCLIYLPMSESRIWITGYNIQIYTMGTQVRLSQITTLDILIKWTKRFRILPRKIGLLRKRTMKSTSKKLRSSFRIRLKFLPVTMNGSLTISKSQQLTISQQIQALLSSLKSSEKEDHFI